MSKGRFVVCFDSAFTEHVYFERSEKNEKARDGRSEKCTRVSRLLKRGTASERRKEEWWRIQAMGRNILLHFSKEALAIIPQIFKGWHSTISNSAPNTISCSNAICPKLVEEKSNPVEEILLHATKQVSNCVPESL